MRCNSSSLNATRGQPSLSLPRIVTACSHWAEIFRAPGTKPVDNDLGDQEANNFLARFNAAITHA
jgi:hypothetical protein